jgi:short-subunit dehydrogenase
MQEDGALPATVITGAGGDIGRALVDAFAVRGDSIIAVVKDEASAAALESFSAKYPGKVRVEHADLSSKDEVARLAGRLTAQAPIRWLVHCAGLIARDGEEESIEQSFVVNTFAPIELSLALKGSITPDGGVLFISSTAGIWGSPVSPIYSASKSALQGFAFALQKILGGDRRSIVVAPGPTNTKMRESIAHDAAKHQSPETLARLILEILDTPDERDQKLFVVRNGGVEKIIIEAQLMSAHSS